MNINQTTSFLSLAFTLLNSALPSSANPRFVEEHPEWLRRESTHSAAPAMAAKARDAQGPRYREEHPEQTRMAHSDDAIQVDRQEITAQPGAKKGPRYLEEHPESVRRARETQMATLR